MTGRNQRQHPRRAVLLECQVDGLSGLAATLISDVSLTGCYVDSLTPTTVGASVRIRVTLAGTPVTLTGHVAHVHTGIGFGMKFTPLPSETREIIQRFLDHSAEETPQLEQA